MNKIENINTRMHCGTMTLNFISLSRLTSPYAASGNVARVRNLVATLFKDSIQGILHDSNSSSNVSHLVKSKQAHSERMKALRLVDTPRNA